MEKKRILRRTAAIAAATAVAALSCVPVYAQKKTLTADDIVAAMHKADKVSHTSIINSITVEPDYDSRQPVVDTSGLPSSISFWSRWASSTITTALQFCILLMIPI